MRFHALGSLRSCGRLAGISIHGSARLRGDPLKLAAVSSWRSSSRKVLEGQPSGKIGRRRGASFSYKAKRRTAGAPLLRSKGKRPSRPRSRWRDGCRRRTACFVIGRSGRARRACLAGGRSLAGQRFRCCRAGRAGRCDAAGGRSPASGTAIVTNGTARIPLLPKLGILTLSERTISQ